MSDGLVVIGISGPAGSGKDVAALSLAALRGCRVIGLADAIKSALDDLDGRERWISKRLEMLGISRRRARQLLGTESRWAARNRRLWVSLLLAKVHFLAHLPEPALRFVVPDVRYPDEELELRLLIQSWGGRFGLLALDRPGTGSLPGPEGQHSSEHQFRSLTPDRTYLNDGPIDWLQQVAVLFFDDLSAGKVPPRDPLNPMDSRPGTVVGRSAIDLSDLEESS